MKLFLRIASVLFGLLLTAPVAVAQLDLPDKPKSPEKEGGVDLARTARGDVAPKSGAQGGRGGLDLPATGKPGKVNSEAPNIVNPEPENGAAEAIFEAVRKLKTAEGTLIKRSAEQLVAMGPEGLHAARVELPTSKPGALMTAARALVHGGLPSDRALVEARLSQQVPTRAAGPLVDLLVASEPLVTRLDLLKELTESRYGSVRRGAIEQLESASISPSGLLALKASGHAEVRELAYSRLASLEPAGVSILGGADALHTELLAGLSDSSSRVSTAATLGISRRIQGAEDPLVMELIDTYRTVQGDRDAGPLALLALLEAEDRLGRTLVPEEHAVLLLIMMRQGTPFVRAVTAAALAGIGFRSDQSVPWLDQEVTVALIGGVAGESYYPQFGVTRGLALRRLEQITGQHFGSEGPLWKEWWAQNGATFSALRAVIPVTAADHGRLEVRWIDPNTGLAYRLVGSEVESAGATFPGAALHLAPADSQRLMEVLSMSGTFGAERLPGLQGAPAVAEAQLTVVVDGHSKAFRIGTGPEAEWLDPIRAVIADLHQVNQWQLFPLPQSDLAAGEDFYTTESAWWHAHPDPVVRSRRLAELILVNMRLYPTVERTRHVSALRGLPAGTLTAEHFPALADRFADEDFLGERARHLLDLALLAAHDGQAQLSDDDAGRLLDVLVTQSGTGRQALLTEVAEQARPDFARTLALDPRPELRAVAARALAHGGPSPEDLGHLQQLLVDMDPTVEAAAVLAVSEAGLGDFRDAVQARARVADSIVRLAAIRGTGLMGGPNAVDILRLVVLDRDMQVKLAGAEALADLADPRGATLLTQMFASGERGPFYGAARRGLLAIGEPAWDDLLKMARSASHPASRSAMLLLSEQAVTEVMTTLLQVLTDNPNDTQMARELAVMTGVDFAMEEEPAREWWVWHDAERDKTALGWFVAAANKHVETSGALEFLAAGLAFAEADLAGDGTPRGAEALIEFLRLELPSHLQTRALRELRRILNEQRLTLPPKGRMRTEWCDKLHTRIPAVFEAKAHAAAAREKLKRPEPPAVEVDAADGAEGDE